MWRAGDPFSLSNKMSIGTAPAAANLLYLLYFRTHIQAVPNTSILVRDVIEDSGSKQEWFLGIEQQVNYRSMYYWRCVNQKKLLFHKILRGEKEKKKEKEWLQSSFMAI